MKRIFSLLFTAMVCLSLLEGAAFAYYEENADESDISFTASLTKVEEDGTIKSFPIDVQTKTEQIAGPVSRYSDSNGASYYATTATVRALPATDKDDTSTRTEQYVTATITIFWKDVLGIKNEFMGVSGSWTVATDPETGKRATLSDREVRMRGNGVTSSSDGKIHRIYPTTNTFTIPDSDYEDGWWAYEAESLVKLNSSYILKVSVSTGQIGQSL